LPEIGLARNAAPKPFRRAKEPRKHFAAPPLRH